MLLQMCHKRQSIELMEDISMPWSKKHGGKELHIQFWKKKTWSTFKEEFTDNMKKLNEISSDATRALMAYLPYTWCRAYFCSRHKC